MALGARYSSGGGKVYGSAPTNTAVTNLAHRIFAVGTEVMQRCNETVMSEAPFYRRPAVVRGYRGKVESDAFFNILRTGVADDTAYQSHSSSDTPRWKLGLSATNWLLALLRSKSLACSSADNAVKQLDVADAIFLHDIQADIDAAAVSYGPLGRLSRLARGEMTWKEYCEGTMVGKETIHNLMKRIIDGADFVLTTPAGAQTPWFEDVWAEAKVIVVDEAGCMHKADLCSLWGNTLRPIILGGDVKQLPPAMMELNNVDANGNNMNRFALGGRISALGWLQACGIPTFRLLRQMRMATDMFGLAQKLFYADHIIGYGPGSDPSLERHAAGRAVENYLANRPLKGYQRPPDGKLLPVFLHMPKTRVYQVGSSKINRVQMKGAVDLVDDIVKVTGLSPTHFVIITGHRPNVDYGNRILKDYPRLAGMRKVQTVDSIQGDEEDIVIDVLGTTESVKTVGFIANPNRLNVMLTRQKSALIIVGDKLVTGRLSGSDAVMTKLMTAAKKGTCDVERSGEAIFTKTAAMRELLLELHTLGRIIEIPTGQETQAIIAAREKELADREKELAEAERQRELAAAEERERETARVLDYLTNKWLPAASWADLDDDEDLDNIIF